MSEGALEDEILLGEVLAGRYVEKATMEKAIGRSIDPEVWNFCPLEHRLVVLRDEAEGQIGKIIVPDIAKEPLTTGYVIRAGPAVGVPASGRYAQVGYGYNRETILGTRVLFGKFAGVPLLNSAHNLDEESEYILLDELDLQGILEE